MPRADGVSRSAVHAVLPSSSGAGAQGLVYVGPAAQGPVGGVVGAAPAGQPLHVQGAGTDPGTGAAQEAGLQQQQQQQQGQVATTAAEDSFAGQAPDAGQPASQQQGAEATTAGGEGEQGASAPAPGSRIMIDPRGRGAVPVVVPVLYSRMSSADRRAYSGWQLSRPPHHGPAHEVRSLPTS